MTKHFKKEAIMKQSKPRNYVALALMKRNGAGAHDKSSKAKRAEAKRQLMKEIKKPSKTDGFFITQLASYHLHANGDPYLFMLNRYVNQTPI
jgi:hypothetical protein